jgi:hypothetical protein
VIPVAEDTPAYPEDERRHATQMIAQNALAHPTWGQDAHAAALEADGISRRTVNKFARAIGEAIQYSTDLIFAEATEDGWVYRPSADGWISPDNPDAMTSSARLLALYEERHNRAALG